VTDEAKAQAIESELERFKLADASLAEIQNRASDLVPLGWCNQCITEAKGGAKDHVNAAITICSCVQQLRINGQLTTMVLPLPLCNECIAIARTSNLLTR
jgi:hypothetical protein